MISIITPTYNRAKTLIRLHHSLLAQTSFCFEWIIVDDGSDDETYTLLAEFERLSTFSIRYFKKNNGGKHTALNLGFTESVGDWVFVVDSDDWLMPDAIEILQKEIFKISYDYNSISMLKVYESGAIVGDLFPANLDTYIDKINANVSGDKADIFRRKDLSEFSFPEFSSENFMAESPIFLHLGSIGRTKFLNFSCYVCEYMINGLSANSIKNRHRCIKSTLFVYENQYTSSISYYLKIKAAINWWRFSLFKQVNSRGVRIPRRYAIFGLAIRLWDRIKTNA